MLGDSVPTTYLSGRTTLPLSFSAYRWAETYEDGVRLRDHIEGVSALTALIAGGIATARGWDRREAAVCGVGALHFTRMGLDWWTGRVATSDVCQSCNVDGTTRL